ncbi:hypothetical protein B0H14DRAFT_2858562 [Mycena olivaceomarginata]|nr:hypothetical protein B0H14DRAFT_2858562 [Mycena olivaceomarginata]
MMILLNSRGVMVAVQIRLTVISTPLARHINADRALLCLTLPFSPPLMSFSALALSVAIAATPVHAFDNNNNVHHRSTTSRIIGAVIGVAVLLAILAFICVARRRRARSAGPILGGPGFAPGNTKPAFGGFNRPWGQQQNQNTQWQQQQPNQGSYFPGGAPAGGKYPPPAGSSEPAPPYTPQPGRSARCVFFS